MAERDFHRGGDELFASTEWGDALRVDARVALALGPEPLTDARRRLPPITLAPASPGASVPDGPNPSLEFIVELRRAASGAVLLAREAQAIWSGDIRARLDFPRVWAETTGRGGATVWILLHETAPDTRINALAACWELTGLLTLTPQDTVRELRRYARDADAVAQALQMTAQEQVAPDEAAVRAGRLLALRRRFGRGVEMRLIPTRAPFAARDVWRAAYSLGLEWGDLDLFHWRHAPTGARLFTLSALGQPGYFLPERAAEGQRIAAGIAVGFELPTCPAPLDVYDRLALALLYLQEKLSGRPAAPDGADLDADRLDEGRDALAKAVDEMKQAGIAPGSLEAARFF